MIGCTSWTFGRNWETELKLDGLFLLRYIVDEMPILRDMVAELIKRVKCAREIIFSSHVAKMYNERER